MLCFKRTVKKTVKKTRSQLVRRVSEVKVNVKLSVKLGLGELLELYNKVTERISRLCFLTFATLVSEVGSYKKNTLYEDGDVKKLSCEETFRN